MTERDRKASAASKAKPHLPKRTVILHTRVEEDLAERLQELAVSEERKLSQYIARVLRAHVVEIDKTKVSGRDK